MHNQADRILEQLRKQDPRVFVEAGAKDGVDRCINNLNLRFQGKNTENWTTVNIEPNPYLYERLTKNRPDSFNLNVALSSTCGESCMRIPTNREHLNGSGTLSAKVWRDWEQNGNREYIEKTVETITYGEAMKRANISDVGVFVLDVEGHELDVLIGMASKDPLPALFCLEWDERKSDIERLRAELARLGYHTIVEHKIGPNALFRRGQ